MSTIDPDMIDNAYDPDGKMDDPRQPLSDDHNNVVYEEPVFGPDDDYESIQDSSIESSRLTREDDNTTQTSATPRREFKYSTANMQSRGRWCKYLSIALIFGLFIAFSIGISMLIQHLFFGDQSDNGPQGPTERSPNETFPHDKIFIDKVCSSGTIEADEGSRCRDACEPKFSHCCDPFKESNFYNYESYLNATNATLPPEIVYDDDTFESIKDTCTFDTNTRGCMSYAKCQANDGKFDPAPGTLPILCSPTYLAQGRDSCEDLCQEVRCCFSEKDNCLADNLAACMDYAPCQNLRRGNILQAAPDDLDKACLLQLPECFETCRRAECCGDPASTCFKENFLTCLTYAPCHNITQTSVSIPPQFNTLPPPPRELALACNEKHADVEDIVEDTCGGYCEPAMCCYDEDPENDCFRDDPLGCLAYNQECQVLFNEEPESNAGGGGLT